MQSQFEQELTRCAESDLGIIDPEVSNVIQFAAGKSRGTFGFDVRGSVRDGSSVHEELIIRIDPADEDGSLVPSNMAGEYGWYKTFFDLDTVPVPEPLLLDTGSDKFGAPFMLMRRLHGATDFATIRQAEFDATRQHLVREAYQVLGRIAATGTDHVQVPNLPTDTAPGDAWIEQLDYWERVLIESDIGPLPITWKAIRMLRRNPPPAPERLSVVHGDYRLGNFLYDTDRVLGVLDWELGHIGDPHEDLGWASLNNWRTPPHVPEATENIWGIVEDKNDAYAAWEDASGLKIDPFSLAWWTLFNHIKATALWVKGASAVTHRKSTSIDYVAINWFRRPQQETWMTDLMKEIG